MNDSSDLQRLFAEVRALAEGLPPLARRCDPESVRTVLTGLDSVVFNLVGLIAELQSAAVDAGMRIANQASLDAALDGLTAAHDALAAAPPDQAAPAPPHPKAPAPDWRT